MKNEIHERFSQIAIQMKTVSVCVCVRLVSSIAVYPIKLDTFQLRNCGRLESIFCVCECVCWATIWQRIEIQQLNIN